MKKYLTLYSIWISLASAVYAAVYLSCPIGAYGLIWMTFVSLPIYFNAGAKAKEFPHYVCSMLAGIVWGIIFLWFVEVLSDLGLSVVIANALNLLIATTVCLVVHMVWLGDTWVGKVPMIFGALSMMFSQGGENIVPVIVTLFGGLILGVAISTGGAYLEKKI